MEHDKKTIGYIGLGKMGLNMVERLLEKGYMAVAYNRSMEPVKEAIGIGAQGAFSLDELISFLPMPRTIWIMVTHDAVDAVLADLVPKLAVGDTIIDGGNCFYIETMRRAKELEAKKINFIDAGVSGGPSGARLGAAIMVGGNKKVVERYKELFTDLAVPNGSNYMGESGAGHFVKMVHNGIEYGMMQSIAEGFAVLKKSPFDFNLPDIAEVYNSKSVIESRLIGWLKDAFAKFGMNLESISSIVAHSGEGEWTVETAKKLGIPVPIIEKSLQFRVDSEDNPSYTGKVLTALRNQFGGHSIGSK